MVVEMAMVSWRGDDPGSYSIRLCTQEEGQAGWGGGKWVRGGQIEISIPCHWLASPASAV